MQNHKKLLREKGISIYDIGRDLKIDATVVSRILNDKYEGADLTKKRVTSHIEYLLMDKIDFNPLIYSNVDLFIKGIFILIKTPKFKEDETQFFLDIFKQLNKYKNANTPNRSGTN